MRSIKTGDLIWTRLAENASQYYLCRVGEKVWADREITSAHRSYDINNFVSAEWRYVGTEDMVPGKVANSFIPPATAQKVSDVGKISKLIWNQLSQNKYDISKMDWEDFWTCISSEDLECLVFLYLQAKGYYIYSSTVKKGTGHIEGVLVSKDGTHKAYPQVKKVTALPVGNYLGDVERQPNDKVYLFTTSENYGTQYHPNIVCIKKEDLKDFIMKNELIIPATIKYWLKNII